MNNPQQHPKQPIVILGATASLAKPALRTLLRLQNAPLYLVAKEEKKLTTLYDQLVQEFPHQQSLIRPVVLTMQKSFIESFAEYLYQQEGCLHSLISFLGTPPQLTPIQNLDTDSLNESLYVNIQLNLKFIQSFHNLLLESPLPPKVIVHSSAKVKHNEPYFGDYLIAKSALEALAQTYANENKNSPLSVHIIRLNLLQSNTAREMYQGRTLKDFNTTESYLDTLLGILSSSDTNSKIWDIT